MTKSLPEQAVKSIQEYGTAGREAWQRGAIAEAETAFLQAWKVLPEPKSQYDYAQTLSRGMVTFYRDTKQFDKAYRWIEVARAAYGPEVDDFVEFLAGTVYFEAGDLDRAFATFDDQYKKYRQTPFKAKDKRYLE